MRKYIWLLILLPSLAFGQYPDFGGLKLPGTVQGVVYRDASGNLAVLPAGTAGQVLKTNNTGSPPEWINASGGGDMLKSENLSGLANYGTARTNMGLVIGTNVQAYDADLTTYAGITPSANVQTLLGSADFSAFKTSLTLNNVTNESKATMFTSPAFTGTVTGATITTTGAITSSGTAGLGYSTGAGGTVTQATSKTTTVVLNKTCGEITMNGAALAAAAEAKFTVTNSTVAATDIPVVAIKSVGTSGSYVISVTAVAAGSFDITISNVSAGSLSQALVISFGLIKGATN